MNARQKRAYEHRDVLTSNGWSVSKRDSVAFNSGSETLAHATAKLAIAWVYKQQGYRVSSECAKDGVGEIDLVVYGTEDPPLAIEVERNMTDEVIRDKISRYVDGEPYRDCIPVDGDTIPDVTPLKTWAEGKV